MRDSGAETLVSAVAAGTKPDSRPCRVNARTMCQGSVATPAISVVVDANTRARTNIALRPNRSASTPHTGATTSRPIPRPA